MAISLSTLAGVLLAVMTLQMLPAARGQGSQRGAGTWIDPAMAADLDLDGVVGDGDFVLFSLQYDVMDCREGAMPEDCSADLDHDGVVDDKDFVLFMREYNLDHQVLS
ncbi:MAG: hypothetical protein U0570_00855 [Phycisphaerales bacterium]